MIVANTNIRVRYADTDQMRVVYHAKYFEYFEQGRSDLMREIGLSYSRIEEIGLFLPVAEAFAKYLLPARYDDLVTVRTMLKEVPSARVRLDYELRREGEDELLATGHTIHSFIDAKTGKVSRAPVIFTDAVSKAFQ